MRAETREPGDVRTGFFIFEGVDRRDITAALTNLGNQSELSSSIDHSDRQGAVRRWFSSDRSFRSRRA